jgi:hypothetical protein
MSAGAVLMALALWAALRSGHLPENISSLRSAPASIVAALVLLPVASWLLTSTLFWILTRRFGAIDLREMVALIGDEIPVRASARVLVEALFCTALAASVAVAILAAIAGHTLVSVATAAGALAAGAAVLGALKRLDRPLPLALLLLGVLLRVADLAAWWARYWLLLGLAGIHMTPLEVTAVTIASQVASLTPVQFGLREWAVGGVTSLLRTGQGGILAAGLSVDLLNRGLEVIVSIPIGLLCSAAVARRVSAHRARSRKTSGTAPNS